MIYLAYFFNLKLLPAKSQNFGSRIRTVKMSHNFSVENV